MSKQGRQCPASLRRSSRICARRCKSRQAQQGRQVAMGEDVTHPAWMLIVVGTVLAVVGLVWLLAPAVPGLGRLPGDIVIERDNLRIYFPLTTCILLSALLSGIIWLVRVSLRQRRAGCVCGGQHRIVLSNTMRGRCGGGISSTTKLNACTWQLKRHSASNYDAHEH